MDKMTLKEVREAPQPRSTLRLMASLESPVTVSCRVNLVTVLWTLVFLVAGLVTRLYHIDIPASVAWDETHFGKFANRYLKREFYFDVHPPLAKMLIALAGLLTGYRGDFSFEAPGIEYEHHLFIGMRVFCALMGGVCVPMIYLCVRELSHTHSASVLAACLFLFDSACITISKYILLDPILLFFIVGSALFAARVNNQHHRAFSLLWWAELLALGVMLSGAIGSKWVGLFVVLYVGSMTVANLWHLWGNTRISLTTFGVHFLARAAALIAVPLCLYAAYFSVHFMVCNHSGDGDALMSSAFQTTLKGNELHELHVPEYLAYGSEVSIKAHRISGGLLHSHPHLYPDQYLAQQQITIYPYRDDNNFWILKKSIERPEINDDYSQIDFGLEEVEFIRSGEVIRLEHKLTRVLLHSHLVHSFGHKHHQQVSGYGGAGVGDENDLWRIERIGGQPKDRIKTLTDRFRLIHVETNCVLSSDGKNYPKWGFEQGEVTCIPLHSRDKSYRENGAWNVEYHAHRGLNATSVTMEKPSFLSNFLELQVAMARSNNALLPKENEVTSQPWQWPINYKGQIFTKWGPEDTRIYLLGGPVVFAINLCALVMLPILFLVLGLLEGRGCYVVSAHRANTQQAVLWCFLGWLLHYVPYFLMDRVLYFHHYIPAAAFSSMLSGVLFNFLGELVGDLFGVPKVGRYALTSLCIAGAVWGFVLFKDMSYGMTGPRTNYDSRRWMASWDI